MSEEDDAILVAEVEVGEKVRAFRDSEVGRYLRGRARQDADKAKKALLDLDPYQFTDLKELQNAILNIQTHVRHANQLKQYMDEAIVNGEQALTQLSQEIPED